MSLYNYIDTPNPNLICCICRTPFTDPVTARACAHTFCRDCIFRAIEHSSQCPVDRSPLHLTDFAPANPIVRSLVDELVVECIHRGEGCMYTCQRQLLPAHLLDSCLYREVPSPQREAADLEGHTQSGPGPNNVHNMTVSGISSASTEAPSCRASPTSPTITGSIPSPVTSPERLSDVLDPPGLTSHTSDTVEGSTRLASLTEQNILLRHRVDTLEGAIHSFRNEMSSVKRALGPWFRAGESMEASSRNMFTAELPLRAQSNSTPTSAIYLSAGIGDIQVSDYQSYRYPYTHRYPFPSPADSLAPYFPAELDDSVMPAFQYRLPVHRTSASAEMVQQYDVHNASHGPSVPLVAPLNLSTTLEGSLHGLRESVMGLAASVDSLSRRQDIALTNETTRMAEEVGGLRAGIHGLRMQVHAIMMDRNAQLTGRDGVGDNLNGQWMPLPVPPPQTRPFYAQQTSITKL